MPSSIIFELFLSITTDIYYNLTAPPGYSFLIGKHAISLSWLPFLHKIKRYDTCKYLQNHKEGNVTVYEDRNEPIESL